MKKAAKIRLYKTIDARNENGEGALDKKADSQIGIRISKEFKLRIEAQAKKEQRSLSNLILKILWDYLAHHNES